jgi:hypothetical protein
LRRTPSGALCGNIAARTRVDALGQPPSATRPRPRRHRQPPSSDGKCPRNRSLSTRIRSTDLGRRNGNGTRETASATSLGPSDPSVLQTPVRRAMWPWFRPRPRRDTRPGRNPGPRTGAKNPCDPSGAKPAPSGTGKVSGTRVDGSHCLRTTAESDAPVWTEPSAFGRRRNFRQPALEDIRVLGHGRKPVRSRRPKPASSDKGGGKRTGDLRVLCRLGLRPSLGRPRSKWAFGPGWEADPSSAGVLGPLKGMVLQPPSGGGRGFRMGQPQRLAAAVRKGARCH